MENYFGAYWKNGPLTMGEFIERLYGFLKQLQPIHPHLRGWQLVGERPDQKIKIEPDLSNLIPLAQKHAWDKDTPKNRFTNLNEMMEPSLDSVSRVGYMLHIENRDEETKGFDHAGCLIMAGASSPWLKNSVVITVPDESPLSQPEIAIRIFKLLVDFWSPDRAVVTRPDFNKITYKRDDVGSIGWMTFFANPAASAMLPKDVIQRPFGRNGVLILTSPEMPRPGDTKAEDTAIRVAEALRRAELTS